MSGVNRQITLAARPVGFPKESDFKMVEIAMPEPAAGEVLLRTTYLSVDPYMRGRMNDAKSYAPSFQIGQPIQGGVVAKVVKSYDERFSEGDYVQGMLPWQDYSVASGSSLQKLDPKLAPLSTALEVLGMPGLTAYFGLIEICHPKAGETVFVSGAAGAVGTIVGQIGKIIGCRVVGSAGADDKVDYLVNTLGFDAAFNYKTVTDYSAKLRELCPSGIDVYFDNVGGTITDAVLANLNSHARISVCGQISQYNLEKPELGPSILRVLLVKQARAEGFLVFQYADRYPEGISKLAAWVKEGKIKYAEEFTIGLESAPKAFIGMLKGQKTGKQLVKIPEE